MTFAYSGTTEPVTLVSYLPHFIFIQFVKPPLIFKVMSDILLHILLLFFFKGISQQDYCATVRTATGIDWVCTACHFFSPVAESARISDRVVSRNS